MQEQAVFTQKTEPVPPTGRFAPSPSGRLHLGNLDAERCPRIYADLLEQDLDWLGLAWDEGGSTGGPNGPYYQSECAEIYTASYKKLEERGLVYPCFCSRAQLHAASAPHTSDGNVSFSGVDFPCVDRGFAREQSVQVVVRPEDIEVVSPVEGQLVGVVNDAGIVISASHNPMEFNGIKIFAGTGYKLPDEVENEIEVYIDNDLSLIHI